MIHGELINPSGRKNNPKCVHQKKKKKHAKKQTNKQKPTLKVHCAKSDRAEK